MKKILGITSAPGRHWVGDGFPVHGMFGYSGPDVPRRSPFLLLDYAAPTEFSPNMAGYVRDVKAAGGEVVLVTPLTRRTFNAGHVVTWARLWHPADRYQLGGRFARRGD